MRVKFGFVGVLAIAAASVAQAHAQSAPADRSLMFNPNSVQQPAAAAPKPAAPATKRADRKATQPVAQPRPDMPQVSRTVATDRPTPQIEPPTLGRIPFETGSLGVTTNRQYTNTTFADGRVTPGFENIQTKSPSYFGLSLSVPTDKQRLFPLPLFSRPD